jgi:DNA-binding transcriptional regulator YhcF (GntR family)
MVAASAIRALSRPVLNRLRQNFPKVKFDFDLFPRFGVSPSNPNYQGIVNQLRRPGSFVLTGERRGERLFGSAVGKEERFDKLKTGLINKIDDFEETKILSKELYVPNKNALTKEFKVDYPAVKKALKEVKKEGYKFKEAKAGQQILSGGRALPKELQDTFKTKYKDISISQMARDYTGKSSQNPETMAIAGQLSRFKDSLVKQKIIKAKDVKKGTEGLLKREGIEGTPKGFAQQRKTVENLMRSDPKNFSKYVSPFSGRKFDQPTLYREAAKFINMHRIKGGLSKDFPKPLLPSLEHTPGVTPGAILGDPSYLRKVEPFTRRYNMDIMGARSSLYSQVKNNVKAATAELAAGRKADAQKVLGTVNDTYKRMTEYFPALSRKDFPLYKIKGNKIIEVNKKEVLSQQTLRKSFRDYLKRLVPFARPEELAIIKKTQPNVYKTAMLYNQRRFKEADKILSKRLPIVQQGGLFAAPIIATPIGYDLYDRSTYPSNPQQREALFASPVEDEPGFRSAILDL